MDPITSATVQSALQIAEHVVKRQVGYIFNYKDKFKEVEQYIERLDDTRKRVQNEVNDAEKNGEEINYEVQHWLKQVDEKIKKYECFINDERHAQTRCSIRLIFPNYLSLRYRLGRKATKMVEEIKADGHSNKKFDKVSYRLGPSSDAALLNTGYVSFGSRNETMEKIMKALEDSTVNIVGVYGAGGVGKTTLVKEVANKAREKKLFNMVVMANVTRIPDTEKIQGQIAEMLGMRLEEESEIVRADRIRKRLMKEKESTLIILDDLWDGLNLNILGIPRSEDDDGSQQDVNDLSDFGYHKMEKEVFSADFHTMKKDKLAVDFNTMKKGKLSVDSNMIKKEKLSGDHKGCKILLTSRSKEVICNKMDVQERSTFSVGVLDENEAKSFLKKLAGIHAQSFDFDEKVIEIAKMCDGLPMALVSIGRALKNKSSFVWQDVCQRIKTQSFTEGHESIEFSVNLSYEHLKNEQLKHIFLLCARMGNDALIMDLVKFCIGLRLLQGVHTIREARNKVNILIEELKESTLLVESLSRDRFNMHDIVRDVALSISSKEKHVFFMKNGIVDEWPPKDELERYTAICLQFCDINDELPESIHCPRLEVLHIDSKDDFLKIPDDFFKDMIELRVLILTGVNLSCLPSSIKCLKKLRMLSLERCTLGENLSIIGELKKLRILTLSGSNIESLPLEFGQLDKLQLFDISNCSKLRVIPSNTISRMKSLEEFYMRDSLILWEAEENFESQKAILSELRHLNQLQNLDVHIQSVSHFPQNLFLDMLDSYKIVIGEFNMLKEGEFKIPDMYDKEKFLALNLKEGIDIHSETWVKMLFKSVEYLLLGELNDVRDVFYELNVEGFPYLKHLSIVNNFGIQYIINSVERFHPLLAFPKLESMCLYKLDNLEKICGNNHLEEASFCRLKVIKIKTCDKLETIFPFFMVGLLTMLETIEVCDCDSLKEIVSIERQHTINDDKIEFPKLRVLTLKSLPAFACLYTNDKMPCSAQSLEVQVQNRNKDIITEVEQGATSSCISLFNEKVSIPKLEWLELSSINIQKIWSDQSQHCFQNLLTLNVTDCGDLKYLLSFSMAGSLMNLQSLFVSACEMMEDIFCPEHAENIDVFPKLKKMEIIGMEKLNTIWQPHIGLHSFHSLDTLIIGECHKLVTIFPSYMGQRFQSLQSLTITNCQLVENIFDFENIPQTGVRNETNLQNVFLEALPNLVHIWKEDSSEILKYNNLKSISINESPNLKHLFPLSVATDLEKLEILDVYNCRAMKEIVAWGNGSNENAITFKFPQLNTVSLQNSFELVSFYRGTHALEWPSLKKLSILNCFKLEGLTKDITNSQGKPIVSATEKVIYNLESMEISLKEAEWLQKYIVSVHRMHKLQRLVLYGLKNTEILFWFLHRLPNLKSLTLGSCQLKSIWAPASLISRDKIGVVMQLKELELKSLLSLEEIGFEHHPLLQRIERLVISRCMKLTNLASSIVSYNYITHLEVRNCRSLRNLMTSSTAKSLVQLTTMKVFLCEMIVEIVAENEEEKVQEIEFRQLKSLELVSLKNLTSFCSSEKCDFKFPLLESLVVSECPQMKKFSRVKSALNLKKVHVVAGEKDKWYWEGDLNDTLQKHFTDQVSFEYSKHKRLVDYPETKGFRQGKPAFPENFFGCLKKLEFDGECIRQIVIPSHVLPYLKTLEELYVHNSDAVQIIFDMDHSEAKTKGIVSRLKKLTLEDLSNLKCVWNKNPRGILCFPHLQQVVVSKCRTLATLFPLSLARNLGKLKTLKIQICDKLVEIVGKEDVTEHGTTEMFEFPCLWQLLLYQLSLLSCFYPGKHHLECPVLKCLDMSYCPKLKLFTSEFHNNHKEAVIEAPISRLQQQPLFSVDKIVRNLKELTLNEENIMLLSDAHLPEDFLCKLISLDLSFDNDDIKKDTLPFDFLHKVPSVECLRVQRCYGLKEIFPSQKLQVHDRSLPELKQLRLFGLGELETIGLEHPWVKPYSEKLQILDLLGCPQLEKLVSCVVSFINLKELQVTYCNRMKYLLKCSTAKSLLQLETLYIRDCESMKEIVKKEEEDASDEIIFGSLRTIMLDSLPRLVRFYSGNATLHFKCLEEATIAECQNMKTFSEGIIDAPLLEGIKTSTEDTDLNSHHDLNTTIHTLFHQQVFFEYSKHMILVDYLETTGVRHGKPAFLKNFFGSFKKLEFDGAIKREIVIPSHVLPYLKTLEELYVHSSDAAQVIFDIDDADANTKGMVLPLKKLILKDLSNLKCVWNKTPRGILSFSNLQDVVVHVCENLVALFPLSLARNLGKLQTLEIQSCHKLVEIVGKEDVTEHATTEMFEFPSLWKVLLFNLSLLSCFYPGKHHLECPILESLRVSYCPKLKLFTSEFRDSPKQAVIEAQISQLQQQPLFSVEKIAINLKELTLNEENIMLLSDGHLPQDLLFKLRFLYLSFENDDNKKDTLPFDFLQKVPSLEHLFVLSCYGLKEIFPSQKLQVHDPSLPGLKQLILCDLKELESIGLEHPWVKPYSEKLQILDLFGCPQLEELVSCAVSFINLKELEVTCCNRMEYLLKFSTAKSLLQLESLSISECESMKEIVKKEEEDASDEIIFGRLRRIMLDSLPRLVRFYSGNATLHFKCLEEATIAECQNMKTFSEGIIDAPLLEGIKTSTEDTDLTSHHDLNTTIETLFHQQVFFEYSKHMILVDYLETTGVRRGKPAFLKNFFGSLKKLEFDGAIKREIVIPSHVLPYLKTLEELNVHSSDAAQVIFDIDDTDANPKGMVLPLKKLTLKDLSNLKCVWNKTPRGILSFPNLQQVFVTKCRSLATLFPLSLANNLVNLQTLTVLRCDKLVEIVGNEDAMELGTTERFEFPSLWKLLLYKLSLLSSFYPGKHHLECPVLKCLDVSYCPKLKLFTSEFHNSHKEAVIEQPLFMVEKVDPKLKELTLNEENIILLRDAHLPQDFLCKLNILDLCFDDYENKKDTLPFDFLHKVPNVECLRVQRCYGLKEIFPSQKLQVHHGILGQLNELFIKKLKELESIGLEHPWVKPYSAKLEILEIRKCSRLEKVVSCAVSFISLKELQVIECERMEYLFTSSTAKSLVQLKILYIEKCESIKEIVRKEDESDASEEMIFGRLTKLRLESLGRLVRFYSGDGTLQFSCLEEATIAECPNMNSFSEGFVNAPMFEGIKTSTEDSDLKFRHDLNSTIKMLFHQQVEKSACDIENLKFGDHQHLEEIWLGVVPIPSKNCFNSLKSLTVVECESLSNVIPFYLLRFLCNLKEIEVSNCRSVKAIFDMKGTEADMKPASQISLPLKKLILNQLPNLEHICNPNPDEILSLQEVCISNCQSLKSLFPTSVANHLAKLDVRSCATLEEIIVENEAALKGETKPFNFHCLTSLTLWELPELKYFYNGKHSLEWPMLTQLDVYHCDKLKLFTTEHHSGEVADIEYPLRTSIDQQAVFSVEKVFPNLVLLSLKKEDAIGILQGQFQARTISQIVMPSLEHQAITYKDNMIGQGQFVANAARLLQNLKVLKLMCYHEDDESNIFSSGLLEEISSIENLEVFCSSFNEIFSCQIPSTNYTKVHSKLKKLHLKSLQQLNSIGLEHSWVEPLLKTLETLEVFSCPSMKILVPSTVSFSNLTSLNVEECHGLVYLFTSSTAKRLGQLKHMSILDCQAIQEIVSKEGDHESNDEVITFEQLRVLSLESLPSIVGIYSGKYKLKFPSLDQILCRKRELILQEFIMLMHHGTESSTLGFVGRRTTLMDHAATLLFHLIPVVSFEYSKHKRLVDYPETKGFRHGKPVFRENFFGCLKKLEFDGESIRQIVIPSHVLPYLKTLEELYVHNSDAVQIIFDTVDTEAKTKGIIFRLKKLILKDLSNLKCVWNKNPRGTLRILVRLFPLSLAQNLGKLKTLEIQFCDKLVDPKLKELTLNQENIILLRDAHLPQDFLCKLNILDLSFDDYENKKDTLPFDFLHKVPSVECLRVQRCYGLKEIFPSQKLQVHHGILARLNDLFLNKLKELESIGLEHPWVKPYSAKLEILEIRKCSRLEKVVSCAVSFISLKELYLSECERMEYLFTFSTVKSLVQLKMLYIEKCESIKEIVRKEDESDVSEEMIFGRLTKLRLESLGRLVRFYSGDGTLQFSCLEEATIAECPNMNSFSEGFVNAPMFEGIKTSREDSDLTFHHDLNYTIKMLFHQQVEKSACDIEHLKFGDHHHLEEIWLC
ncbi:putative disease resistance protein [Glycine soja]